MNVVLLPHVFEHPPSPSPMPQSQKVHVNVLQLHPGPATQMAVAPQPQGCSQVSARTVRAPIVIITAMRHPSSNVLDDCTTLIA
jgi:hypothetical protein